jgi:outer membrane protein OmpA-like peptidoglycan-associated protein
MKKLILLLTIIVLSSSVYSQIFQETRFGVGAGAGFGVNESKDRPLNFSARGFVRYPFSDMFFGDLGVGYLNNSGQTWYNADYKTSLIPIDIRINFAPAIIKNWLPYAYVGLGGSMFSIIDKSPAAAKDAKESGFAPFFVGGAGFERKLTDNFSIDFHFSGNHHFNDELLGEKDDVNDGYWNFGLSLIWTPGSGRRDDDGDGLSTEFELQIGTDPNNADTDGDGLSDGQEYNKYKTDPKNADTDGDELKDGVEVNDTKTDPLDKDTDKDGLTDGGEIIKYKTDALNKDTDKDGLTDGDEVTKIKTDPLKEDTDGDGLNDGEEVNKYKTNPLLQDSDKDGLTDGEEVNKYKTEPLNPDTDGEGLKDGEEVLTWKTDPLKKDTDNGTVDDFTEVKRGTNPLEKKDDVEAKKQDEFLSNKTAKIELEGVAFETGKADIKPESEEILNRVLKTLKDNPTVTVEISGHTDNVGNKKKNQKLSEDRAISVKNWLVTKGIAENRMTTAGYGPDRPKVPNDTPENKAMNRRIEMQRTDK